LDDHEALNEVSNPDIIIDRNERVKRIKPYYKKDNEKFANDNIVKTSSKVLQEI
jgi:hypothetical protein